MITLEQIASRCDKVRWNGKDSFLACCVAHNDRNPSMSVTAAPNGTLLAHCHAGCPQDAVIEALGFFDRRDDHIPSIGKSAPAPDTSVTEAKAKLATQLATAAPDSHPYLVKKKVKPHGIGVLGELYKDLPLPVRNKGNVLVVPMKDVDGKILSCQFITEDGRKAYIAGPKRKGGFYCIRGEGKRVWICEGFATGASLHQDTGDSVLIAFDTGGVLPVIGSVTAKYGSELEFIIMADDDWKSDGNPGFTAAREAASATGIRAVRPVFSSRQRGDKDTDYNDMVVHRHA